MSESEANSYSENVKIFMYLTFFGLGIVFFSAIITSLQPQVDQNQTSLSRRSWCIENCAPDLVLQWSPASNLGCMCAGEPLVLEQTE